MPLFTSPNQQDCDNEAFIQSLRRKLRPKTPLWLVSLGLLLYHAIALNLFFSLMESIDDASSLFSLALGVALMGLWGAAVTWFAFHLGWWLMMRPSSTMEMSRVARLLIATYRTLQDSSPGAPSLFSCSELHTLATLERRMAKPHFYRRCMMASAGLLIALVTSWHLWSSSTRDLEVASESMRSFGATLFGFMLGGILLSPWAIVAQLRQIQLIPHSKHTRLLLKAYDALKSQKGLGH